MKIISYLLWIIIIVLGVSFAGLNAEWVSFNYYIGSVKLPLSLLLACFFAVGGVLGVLVSLSLLLRCKTQNRRLRKQLKTFEQDKPIEVP